MPLIKPKFVPGVIKDDSKLAAEGGWTDSDKMRFVGGQPQTIGGWQPVPVDPDADGTVFDSGVFDSDVLHTSMSEFVESYPGQVRAAHAWTDLDGASYLAFGTGAGLFVVHIDTIYDITPADFTPEETASASTYGVGSYGMGVYGRGTRVMWSLDNFGENLLASPRGGKLYEWSLDTAVKAVAVANAPEENLAMFVSPERIVVLLGTSEFGGDFNPMLVRWCDQGVNTAWDPAPTNIAGEFPLSSGSKLVSGLAARGLNVLWSDTSVYSMQFNGSVGSVFTIRPAGYGCGLIGPQAKTTSDNAVYWMSDKNFYAFNGQTASILPSTVRQDVFDHIYPNSEEKAHVAWNVGYGEPWFFYPDVRDGTGECSRYAMVNQQGQWAIGAFDRTAWVRAGVFPFPIAFSANDRQLFYQEMPGELADGEPMDAFIESGFIDIGDGDTLYTIKRIVPDFNNQGPIVDITLKTRMWPNQTETEHGPYEAETDTYKIDLRVKAREMAIRLATSETPSASSFWELGSIAFGTQQSGEKR